MFDKPEVAELLLSRGADVNIKMHEMPPLFQVGSLSMLNILKKYNVDIHYENSHGMTALFMISKVSVVDALIKSGLDPLHEAKGTSVLASAKQTLGIYEKTYESIDNETVAETYRKLMDDINEKIKYLSKYTSRGPLPELLIFCQPSDNIRFTYQGINLAYFLTG